MRQRPATLTCCSICGIEVQQISPLVVLHSELVEQGFGQSDGGRQKGWS